MVISNVCVDLILWIILYVLFRTVYVLDKFYIQWLYCQQWILELSINTVQYNINSSHECYCFLWSSDVASLVILQSVECLLEQRKEKGKVREALVSNFGAKYLLFTQFHIHYSRKLYIPRKRWIEDVEKDIQTMGIRGWRKLSKERMEWKKITEKAKTHSGL